MELNSCIKKKKSYDQLINFRPSVLTTRLGKRLLQMMNKSLESSDKGMIAYSAFPPCPFILPLTPSGLWGFRKWMQLI